MLQSLVLLTAFCAAASVQHDVPKRVVQGERRCRVLLIDFEGRERFHSPESFQTLYFGQNIRVTPGPFPEPTIGSARDYFSELSNGRLRLTGEVMPWVRSRLKAQELPHWHTTRDGGRDWWQPVVVDAMSLNDIPKDDRIDGKPVDFYVIVYSGSPYGYFNCTKKNMFMGAGRRSLPSTLMKKTRVPHWEDRWNGKQIIYVPERWTDKPSGMYGVGLVGHELGHMMCHFTDLYVPGNGPFGRYAIMASGEKTHFPTGPTAYHRYMAGWLTYDVPDLEGRQLFRLPPLESQRAVKLVNGPMPWAESLIVEHRMRMTPAATRLPAEGLLVYECYGQRRVRTVTWDVKAKRPTVVQQRFRFVRADGTEKDEAGDVFRQGKLTLFGTPGAASMVTGCGYWELDRITLPKTSAQQPPSVKIKQVATFLAEYQPTRIRPRRPGETVALGQRLSPGDYRVYVHAAGGAKVVEDENVLLDLPAAGGKPVWGLLDLHVSDKRRPLRVVSSSTARIHEIQIVPRQPKTLNLLDEPLAKGLADGFGGRVTNSVALDKTVWAGGAIEIPLRGKQTCRGVAPMTCPGGVLRLALRVETPNPGKKLDKDETPALTLAVREGEKKQQIYLKNLPLDAHQPEFLLIDLNHLRGKPIELALSFRGPADGRVALWDAGFVAK